MKSDNYFKDHQRGKYDRKLQWRDFYRNAVLVIILFSAASTAYSGKASADTFSPYRESNTYSPVSGKTQEVQNDNSGPDRLILLRKFKKADYSLRENDYIFPDTPFGKFFEKLSNKTRPQIEALRDDLLYCNDNPECYDSFSAEQGKVFTKNVLKSLVLALTEDNKIVSYANEKIEYIESYFTAHIDRGNNKIYNPILSHSGAESKTGDSEFGNDKNTLRFSLKFRMNQGIIGEIKIPSRFIDMNVRHEMPGNKTKVLITFPFSGNVQIEAVRERDNQYAGTIQINHPTKRFEEIIYNLFDSRHISL